MLDESRVGLIAGVGLVLTVAVNFFGRESGQALTAGPTGQATTPAETTAELPATVVVSYRPAPAPLGRPTATVDPTCPRSPAE